MSGATAVHDPGLAPLGPRPMRRRHLRLVGAEELGHPAHACVQPARRSLRITRRGRLAVTATLTLLVAVAVAALVGAVLPAGASSGERYVVEPGQTLSQIAATELPGLSLDQAVVQIQLANELSSLHVQAGQVLEIPTR